MIEIPSFREYDLKEEEMIQFLTEQNTSRIAHIGTVDKKGKPYIIPTWYFFDPSNEMIYVSTRGDSKIAHLAKLPNRNVYFCIDDPDPPKGVRGAGTVSIREDPNFNSAIFEKIACRYTEGKKKRKLSSKYEKQRNELCYSGNCT